MSGRHWPSFLPILTGLRKLGRKITLSLRILIDVLFPEHIHRIKYIFQAIVSAYEKLQKQLACEQRTWLITGAAGFIGSNLLETLLKLNQRVIGLDNFATGHQRNLDEVRGLVSAEQWASFSFRHGDITRLEDCAAACQGVDFVLHQAALGSIPRSLADPLASNASNVTGFLNMLVAARDANAKRFIYAASSSTYGDHPALPKTEENIGKPLSPYAVTKYVNELYADVFNRSYGMQCIGLRYFNVFGARQDPDGAYAAVIPLWIARLIRNEPIYINGDGETSRDFCYIANVVQANLLAACTVRTSDASPVYNVAVGERNSLNSLFQQLQALLLPRFPALAAAEPIYRDFRAGDVRHSLASIDKARQEFGYQPSHHLGDGLAAAMAWYLNFLQ